MKKSLLAQSPGALLSVALAFGFASIYSTQAAPVAGQITPIAIYHDTPSAFGVAYDSLRDRIWFSEGDSGDGLAHSLKPLNAFTPVELAGLPTSGGVYQIFGGDRELDLAGTTALPGTGPFGGAGGAYFASLAYDPAADLLVAQGSGFSLTAAQPVTGAFPTMSYRPGHAVDGFSDGLDITGADTWFSPDVGNIFKNGALWASTGDAADMAPGQFAGWSGVEEAAGSIFAVAIGSFGGNERTIVKFDASGTLVGYDPDGDVTAVRWEDMAFDGRYLYAADLRGNHDGFGPAGDIWVFDTGGGIVIGDPVPEPSTIIGGIALAGLAASRMLRRKKS